jgi:hypothetical protein
MFYRSIFQRQDEKKRGPHQHTKEGGEEKQQQQQQQQNDDDDEDNNDDKENSIVLENKIKSLFKTNNINDRTHQFSCIQNAYLDAYAYRPQRAEALYALILLCCHLKQYTRGALFARTAITIQLPKYDTLFVSEDQHGCHLLKVSAECFFYSGEKKFAAALYKKLLAHERCRKVFSQEECDQFHSMIQEVSETS